MGLGLGLGLGRLLEGEAQVRREGGRAPLVLGPALEAAALLQHQQRAALHAQRRLHLCSEQGGSARPQASGHSRGLFQRQTVPQAARSLGQPPSASTIPPWPATSGFVSAKLSTARSTVSDNRCRLLQSVSCSFRRRQTSRAASIRRSSSGCGSCGTSDRALRWVGTLAGRSMVVKASKLSSFRQWEKTRHRLDGEIPVRALRVQAKCRRVNGGQSCLLGISATLFSLSRWWRPTMRLITLVALAPGVLSIPATRRDDRHSFDETPLSLQPASQQTCHDPQTKASRPSVDPCRSLSSSSSASSSSITSSPTSSTPTSSSIPPPRLDTDAMPELQLGHAHVLRPQPEQD